VNWIAWLEIRFQLPVVAGVSVGVCEPRTLETGFEKLIVIGVVGLIVVPGLGLATAVAVPPPGK
jgi:hypothetical protein